MWMKRLWKKARSVLSKIHLVALVAMDFKNLSIAWKFENNNVKTNVMKKRMDVWILTCCDRQQN